MTDAAPRRFEVREAPHRPPATSVARVMGDVLLALVPGVLTYVWFFGPGVLMQLALALATGLALEALLLHLRGRPLRPFLADLSVPVTAVLYALCLPPLMPWWAAVVGMVFAVVVAKHLYGGLGHNVFNPAMVGYVAVLVSFPQAATAWLPAAGLAGGELSFSETLTTILTGTPPASLDWQGLTRATPLDRLGSAAGEGLMFSEVQREGLFGAVAGRGWEWVALAYAAGGLYLLRRRVISWHVPVATLASVLVLTVLPWAADPDSHASPLFHLAAGGVVLGAFFIATDPVSGATTPAGRLAFGVGVGALTVVIRRWGGYPDGVAFAVLLMNLAVPLLDRYLRPRIFGRAR